MATNKASQIPQQSINNSKVIKSAKELADSSNPTSIIPTNYSYFTNTNNNHPTTSTLDSPDDDDDEHDLPVIDLSLLESGSPDQRSKIVQDLGKACQDWGFFMVVNHGVEEKLMKEMMDKFEEFFNMRVEDKQVYQDKDNQALEGIRYGTSFNLSTEQVHFWRDYLKIMVHPTFHSPSKPSHFREISSEYCKELRRMTRVLLRGISTSLGLDENEIERSMNLDMGLQLLVGNYYPPCPQPNLAIGLPPHSDYGLLTILAQNSVNGLQIQHKGKWIRVNVLPNSFLVNIADHIEIFSNGKYKSVLHQATLNSKATRISIAVTNGPPPDAVVSPSVQLMKDEKNGPPIYKPMKYKDYYRIQQSKRLDGKSCLDIVRV